MEKTLWSHAWFLQIYTVSIFVISQYAIIIDAHYNWNLSEWNRQYRLNIVFLKTIFSQYVIYFVIKKPIENYIYNYIFNNFAII